jgi:hypothetical protein
MSLSFSNMYTRINELIVMKMKNSGPSKSMFYNSITLSDVETLETMENCSNLFTFIFEKSDYDNLESSIKNKVRVLLQKGLTGPVPRMGPQTQKGQTGGPQTQKGQTGGPQQTDLITNSLAALNCIDMTNLNITSDHLSDATKMITETLGLKSDGMNSLIQNMIGDIGSSMQNGASITDMINNLSKDFGNKLNDNIKSGAITKSEVEDTTKNMFTNLQNLTKNPADLMKMVQGASGASQPSETREQAKNRRRDERMKKARSERKK